MNQTTQHVHDSYDSDGEIREWSFQPPGKRYVLREAQTLRELDQVHRITHESIVHAGYMHAATSGRLITYPHLDTSPLTTIILAVEGNRVIGTNSLTADGPLKLHTDIYFPAETDAVRKEGRRLVSSFRIATDPLWVTQSSSTLIMDIIAWTFVLAARRYAFDTMLCTFNPKHEGVYRRLLNARTLAKLPNIRHGAIDAGAVLMRIDRRNIPEKFLMQAEELGRYCPVPPRRVESEPTIAHRDGSFA